MYKQYNEDIANAFKEKFISCDNINNESREYMDLFAQHWQQHGARMHIRVSPVLLRKAAACLNNGEGHDGIHATFLKNASVDFFILFS